MSQKLENLVELNEKSQIHPSIYSINSVPDLKPGTQRYYLVKNLNELL